MAFSWPWSSGKPRIKDLQAPELLAAAIALFQKSGRNAQAIGLIYRALEVNPDYVPALFMMSELFRGRSKGTKPVGDEIFSGIIIEFAANRASLLSLDQRRPFDRERTEIMTLWGFVTSRETEFDLDHLGYMTYMNELAVQVRSLSNGFQMAHVKLGIQAGFLDPVKGVLTRLYKDWLNSDASALSR